MSPPFDNRNSNPYGNKLPTPYMEHRDRIWRTQSRGGKHNKSLSAVACSTFGYQQQPHDVVSIDDVEQYNVDRQNAEGATEPDMFDFHAPGKDTFHYLDAWLAKATTRRKEMGADAYVERLNELLSEMVEAA